MSTCCRKSLCFSKTPPRCWTRAVFTLQYRYKASFLEIRNLIMWETVIWVDAFDCRMNAFSGSNTWPRLCEGSSRRRLLPTNSNRSHLSVPVITVFRDIIQRSRQHYLFLSATLMTWLCYVFTHRLKVKVVFLFIILYQSSVAIYFTITAGILVVQYLRMKQCDKSIKQTML